MSAAAEACGAQLLDKTTFGSRDLPRLVEELAGGALESIELVGLCTDICVISNALLLKAFFPETPFGWTILPVRASRRRAMKMR